MKFQPSAIFDKYANSSRKWLLPIPVFDNETLKLRCFMSDEFKKFNRVYTYSITNQQMLVDFYKEKSLGQAYNKFIKFNEDRNGFINDEDYEEGLFTMEDILQIMIVGRTAYICDTINRKFEDDDFDFNLDRLDKSESKTFEQLKLELAKWERENSGD
jgi:hypothetical protein